MAYTQTLVTLLIFSLLTIIYAQGDELPKPTAIYLPILKNASTHQYYTRFDTQEVDALIDLGAQSVWFDCTTYHSSNYKRVSCGSDQCIKAKDSLCIGCSSTEPECFNNTCGVYAYNPFREYTKVQEFGEDSLMVTSTDDKGIKYNQSVKSFLFSCADSTMVEGLPGDRNKGLVGLGRSQVSLPSQISSFFNLIPKFALCLPSSLSSATNPGDIIISGGPYNYMPSPSLEDQSLSLVRTPLNYDSNEYFIYLDDIEIDGQRVALSSSLLSGGGKISTVVPYTTLHASIYKRLIKDYVKAAGLKNIKKVTNVEPFGACFDSTTVPKTISGPAVPDIDLVMPGNMVSVKMKLSGSNLMVEVKKNVICLAIIDGGAQPRTSVVLGGHQLEDRLLEFDLSTSLLSFSPYLLLSNTSCSHSKLF
ncbi:basic 7S globulin-like protein [Tanacetum coccineum]